MAATTGSELRTRLAGGVRRIAGQGLRNSPPAVQTALRRGSRRLLTALGPPAAGSNGATPRTWPGEIWESPPVPLPAGLSYAQVERMFHSWSVNHEPVGHLDGYVVDSIQRFLHTWGLVRDERGSCLELGANPYFTTHLLDQYSDLELTLANYYGEPGEATETVSYVPPGGSERVEVQRKCELFNVEQDRFPFDDDSFDVLLFCEMLEHLLMDPTATLRQIHRVLKPNGVLVVTTPNVCRLDNVLAMVNGANIYDPYSGFGPYGRHNREYNRHELVRLLEFAGFDVEYSMTADGHPSAAPTKSRYDEVTPLVGFRRTDLGHYLFVRARAARPPREGLPSFLYRSWPDGTIVDFE